MRATLELRSILSTVRVAATVTRSTLRVTRNASRRSHGNDAPRPSSDPDRRRAAWVQQAIVRALAVRARRLDLRWHCVSPTG